jgi:hypothetical protein
VGALVGGHCDDIWYDGCVVEGCGGRVCDRKMFGVGVSGRGRKQKSKSTRGWGIKRQDVKWWKESKTSGRAASLSSFI